MTGRETSLSSKSDMQAKERGMAPPYVSDDEEVPSFGASQESVKTPGGSVILATASLKRIMIVASSYTPVKK